MSDELTLRYWDRDGQPIDDTMTWAQLYEDWSYRVVADLEINGRRVVTVWMGIDHEDPFRAENPNIFSTAVFDMDGTEIGEMIDEEYWPTLADAQQGHDMMVKRYLKGQP